MSGNGDWPPGYSIKEMPRTLAPELIAAFADIPVAVAGDCMGRSLGAMGLVAYHQNLHLGLCGPALTVQVRPGDNLMIHKAFMMAQPGDIIVIDGGGDLTQALIGGLMRTTAMTRKIGGFVIDGAIRDLVEWADGQVPVFAKGHTHRGPSKEGPGRINAPIACAGSPAISSWATPTALYACRPPRSRRCCLVFVRIFNANRPFACPMSRERPIRNGSMRYCGRKACLFSSCRFLL
jgi:hypothetical protein